MYMQFFRNQVWYKYRFKGNDEGEDMLLSVPFSVLEHILRKKVI